MLAKAPSLANIVGLRELLWLLRGIRCCLGILLLEQLSPPHRLTHRLQIGEVVLKGQSDRHSATTSRRLSKLEVTSLCFSPRYRQTLETSASRLLLLSLVAVHQDRLPRLTSVMTMTLYGMLPKRTYFTWTREIVRNPQQSSSCPSVLTCMSFRDVLGLKPVRSQPIISRCRSEREQIRPKLATRHT